ncbi:hypothetical protein BGX21_002411, partial [Mortierella sp. AD011]
MTAHDDELIRKGDDYRDQRDFDNAAKSYRLAGQSHPNEAAEKLKLIPLPNQLHERKRDKLRALFKPSPRRPGGRKRDKIRKLFEYSSDKPTSTGPFFPRNDQSCLSLLMSQATDMRKEPISQFKEGLATLEPVRELVILARIPDKNIFDQVIGQLVKIMEDSPLAPIIALQGLAVAINSCPDGIDMNGMQGVYLDILRPLKQRLEFVRSEGNEGQLVPLLYALTALLNAMVCRNVHGLNREGVFNPLNDILDGLKGHDNPTVRFLALYAKQGLAYVGSDESFEMGIYRRGKLAIAVALNISQGISNIDLGEFVTAYNRIMEMCDFNIPHTWYPGLVYVDCALDLQDWSRFEKFVLESKLKSDECFLQGVCLRLEQVAVTQSVEEIRDGAIEFLYSLSMNPSKQVRLAAVAVLERLVSRDCTRHSNTHTKHHVKAIKCTCTTYQDTRFCPPPVWDPSWHATSTGVLLKAVQQKKRNDKNTNETPAKLDNIKEAVSFHASNIQAGVDFLVENTNSESSSDEVRAALESYYKSSLVIRRVSGAELDLDLCYINLVVVEARGQREKDKSNLKSQAVAFQRIPSRGESTDADITSSIPLENLFDERKLPNGDKYVPKRILIHGRAGIGKSTLCKKLVHLHQDSRWKEQFDFVLWLPLRQLKSHNYRNVDGLLNEKYFSSQSKREALSRKVSTQINAKRVLFILDGLDEIVTSTGEDNWNVLLSDLLKNEHVVITSRPSGVDKNILQGIDLELETIGFSPQNIDDYLRIPEVLPQDQIRSVREFIDRTPVVQGLVNIPVQLDVICFSWGSIPTDEGITVTALYQAMVRKLWCKDALRLGKSSSGKILKEDEIHGLGSYQIDELMEAEIEFLGYLAFKGLEDNHRIEFDKTMLNEVMRDLDQNRARIKKESLPMQLIHWLKETSFLHTSDADLGTDARDFQGTWYFLHLTFQEYFAATWLVRHLRANSNDGGRTFVLMMTPEATKEFVLKHKYNPRYEIVWWMVAGQLKEGALELFFDLLQGAPVDLIGGYHHRLLAACLKECRNQLERRDDKRVKSLETQLVQWLQFEMATNDDSSGRSVLGSMSYFPEELLFKSLGKSDASQDYLIRTLESRTTLTQSAIEVLLNALQGGRRLKELAADVLWKHSRLSESALQALIDELQNGHKEVKASVAEALGKR